MHAPSCGFVPLTLVTGPANAAKAGVVVDRIRAWLPREPLLVVPTQADVGHYQRELAGAGVVFGAQVTTFSGLIGAIAQAVGVSGRVLGPVAQERVLRAAISSSALDRLAASADTTGFTHAARDFLAELQRELISPQRLGSAVAQAAAQDAGGHWDQLREVAEIYGRYQQRLRALRAHDAETYAWEALDELRTQPRSWNSRPVLMYGFDDLTRMQLDAVETLSGRTQADVLLTLPYEAGRTAFGGRATTVQTLAPLAAEHIVLEPTPSHYEECSRAALHHLERSLFEPTTALAPSGGAVKLLEAGGERAESELVASEILRLLSEGVPAGEIAVLVRGSSRQDVMASVLNSYEIEVCGMSRGALGESRLGAGLLALARAVSPAGKAQDLLRWLRTPGRLSDPDPVDRLEMLIGRRRISSVDEARKHWQGPPELLERLDEMQAAAGKGSLELLDVLAAEAHDVWMAPLHRLAAVLDTRQLAMAQAATAIRGAIAELRRLAVADPGLLPTPQGALDAVAGVQISVSRGDAGVLIADPLEIRARRFTAVFVCGLEDGNFPSRSQAHAFLSDADRRALAAAGGLVLPDRGPSLDHERYLFYATCSRPQRFLGLSWCSSTEEGDPVQASAFLDAVSTHFEPELWENRRRRLLADVTWGSSEAPTARELRRARAAARREPAPPGLGAPDMPSVLQLLAARTQESARGLENFAACGVRWLVESLLRPARVQPDSDALKRGSIAHAVLEKTLRRLKQRTGSALLSPERIDVAVAELREVIRELAEAAETAVDKTLVWAVHADAERYLRGEAETGAGYEPTYLEWSFGSESDETAPLRLADGTGVTGRVDRIDVAGSHAIVRDYKHRTVHPAARWVPDRRLQAGLYALAARERLQLKPVAAVYQPLSGPDLRPRGILRDDLDGTYVGGDVLSDEDFDAALSEVAAIATQAAQDLRAGRIRSCPQTCSPRGCMYPTICRGAGDSEQDNDSGSGGAA